MKRLLIRIALYFAARLKEKSSWIGIFLFFGIPYIFNKLWQIPRIQEAIIDLIVNILKEPTLVAGLALSIIPTIKIVGAYLFFKEEKQNAKPK